MNTNDLNTALYEKMAAEQDKYRDWLKSQPPEEILHHTYEYTIREDIVMAMEELELTDAQAQALLESPSPLEDVYRYFEKLETGYMDVIRDSIENRADDVCRANVNVEDIENLISSIVTVPIDDGVKFQLKSISEIMDEAEYPGIRVSMSTTFDGVVTPLKIDISTGDAITPREVRYSFKLMLEDRSIDIWAYNLETVLAEKLETIITRTTTNTRMRDFYDIYILEQLHGTTLNPKILHDALLATAHKRGSEKYLNQAEEVFDEVENDSVMQKLWEAYRKKFSYASDLEWDVIMKAIRRLYVLCEKGISL